MANSHHCRQGRIAVLGGGISGLAVAHYLQQNGHQPVVIEATNQLGGLAADFEHAGVSIERFPHNLLPSDSHLLSLLDDLQLQPLLHWGQAASGCYVKGKLCRLDTPRNVLRFGGLSLVDRVRTTAGVKLLSWRNDGTGLATLPVETLLRTHFGDASFTNLWMPLLRAQFGDLYSRVPSDWLWNHIRNDWVASHRIKGHLRGGYREVANTLERSIHRRGGLVRRSAPVEWILNETHGVSLSVHGRIERYDAIVSTIPLPVLREIAAGPLQEAVPLPQLVYQGVVNVVVVSRQPVQPFYRNVISDPRCSFHSMVESTRLIPLQWTGGRSLIHMTRYCRPGSESYLKEDDVIAREATDSLAALFPSFDRASTESTYVFRAPHAQPVWPLADTNRTVPSRIGSSRVFLATAAQGYPLANTWNNRISLAKQAAAAVSEALASRPRIRAMTNA